MMTLGKAARAGYVALAAAIMSSAGLFALPIAATAANNITAYAVCCSPNDLTTGPDGNLWFTEFGKVGRITTAGVVTEFPIVTSNNAALGITRGPDGNLWFTENPGDNLHGKIGMITTSGVVTEFAIPTNYSEPFGIATRSDDNLWFAEAGASQIGKITPAGSISEYPVPHVGSSPHAIIRGPDGNIWFTDFHALSIGRVVPTGIVTMFDYATGPIGTAITSGPDGALWFAGYTGPGLTVPNLVVVKLESNGMIDLYNAYGSVDVIIDVVGWYG